MVTLTLFVIFAVALTWLSWVLGPRSRRQRRRWWIAVLLSLLQFGCSSMQRVDAPQHDLRAQIRAGKYLHADRDVEIITRQGKEVRFRFERIENDAIVGRTRLGEKVSVPIDDVARVASDRIDAGHTAVAVTSGVLLTVMAFMAYAAIALGGTIAGLGA